MEQKNFILGLTTFLLNRRSAASADARFTSSKIPRIGLGTRKIARISSLTFLRLSVNCISREEGVKFTHVIPPSKIANLWAFWTPRYLLSQFIRIRSYWSCVMGL